MKATTIGEQIIKDQCRVLGAAEQLKAILLEPDPPDADVLAKARWYLASALMQHLALKERYMYARLEADQRSQVRAFYGALKADLLQCFAAYTDHMDRWPTTLSLQKWTTYQAPAISVVDRFVHYLQWEETNLFDFIARMQIDISVPSAVSLNWVRKAFDIKDKVEDR